MSVSALRWRGVLLSLCALSIGLIVHAGITARGSLGVSLEPVAGKPYFAALQVQPNSAAAGGGLRSGDVIDLRPMTPASRYRLSNVYQGPNEPFTLYVVRGAAITPVNIVASPRRPPWQVAFGRTGVVWMALFAALLAWRRPDSAQARVLALLMVLYPMSFELAFNNWLSASPKLDIVMNELSAVLFVSVALLASYTTLFAAPPSRTRGALVWSAYIAAAFYAGLSVTANALPWFTPVLPHGVLAPEFRSGIDALRWSLPVVCGLAAIFELAGVERTRFLWAFVPLAFFYLVNVAAIALHFLGWDRNPIVVMLNIALLFVPLGLTYSLLSRRVLDIGFVLNRAAVFSGVSIVLVGAFVLVEWAIGDWMSSASHETNVAVSAGLALILGLSIRFVHGKIESFVDHVLFRKRRENEEAIRRMAREAPYITDRATLLERVERTLIRHADSSFAHILIDEGDGRYGPIDENDPALVSLRADRTPLDLHLSETAVRGEWAYPMVARGRLIGVLVLGPKQSQESYAPDESSAIAQLANSVAGALDVLALKERGERDAVLDAIADLSGKVSTALNALAQPPVHP